MNDLVKILIWAGIGVAIFSILWWRGYLVRMSNYIQETREELKKCTWPTWDELKGSTVVVTIAISLLGLFTYVADTIFFRVMYWLLKI